MVLSPSPMGSCQGDMSVEAQCCHLPCWDGPAPPRTQPPVAPNSPPLPPPSGAAAAPVGVSNTLSAGHRGDKAVTARQDTDLAPQQPGAALARVPYLCLQLLPARCLQLLLPHLLSPCQLFGLFQFFNQLLTILYRLFLGSSV